MRRVLILLAGGVLLGACGGAHPSATQVVAPTTTTTAAPATTTTIMTKAAYLVAANAICQTMNDQTNAIPNPGNDPGKVADSIDQGSAITANALRQLRTLTKPPGEAAALDAIYARVDSLLADAARFSAAMRSGNQRQAQTIGTRMEAATKQVNQASIAYGLTVCGK